MDLDVALVLEKPAAITEESSKDDLAFYGNWEQSNRLYLSLMKLMMAENVKLPMPVAEDV